ncbi:hypothetical protein SELMODRAFT_440827 [Selaginella moellendorffii]|uniref:Uncharacterized protein n=1 Tax=Selaginella moellendorffii TaxID=88036 RepID=D8REN6_SELML|nr:uncharacterized protein LOC9660660 [Selaginella moellendorffii]EFJ29694.1 hypothetical protein SELMODRAFT_440827 [Selaginella moellendorffii]|eukprot:XP_002969606.1 uncharacterized protein LOC9660660 [Selaginella moellendorffii]
MTALNVGGLHVACVSHPSFVRSVKEKSLCTCSYVENTNLQSSWTHSFSKIVLRSSPLDPHGYLMLFPKATNRKRTFRAVSFQDVAENESDGNDSPTSSSSTPTLDWQQRERLWQQLQGSLQHWRQNLKDRGSLQVARELLAITEVRRKSADAKQVLKQKLQTLKPPQPSTLWSSIHPAIKWPVIVFGIFYAAVTVRFGKAVSDDLWRVWTLGPLAMSFYIQAGIYAGSLYQKYGAARVQALNQRGLQLLSDVRTGRLQQELRTGISNAKKFASSSRVWAIQYVKTQALRDLREALARLALWLYTKYEDAIDWLWPSWRVFARLLRNLL